MITRYSAAAGALVPTYSSLGVVADDIDAGIDPYFTLVDDALNDPLFRQIHELAQRTGRLQKQVNIQIANVSNADAAFDYPLLVSRVQQLAVYHLQFRDLVAQFRNSPAYQADAQLAATLQNWGILSQNWANSILAALVGTADAVVGGARDGLNTVVNAAGDVAQNTVWTVLKSLAPVGLAAVLLYFGVRKAERTRTYRRYVA